MDVLWIWEVVINIELMQSGVLLENFVPMSKRIILMGFRVLERAFIWGRFQRFSRLQKLSFSKVHTKYPKDRIWAIFSYCI